MNITNSTTTTSTSSTSLLSLLFHQSPKTQQYLPFAIPPPSEWKTYYILPVFLGYLLLVRSLRYRGEHNLRKKLGFPEGCGRDKLRSMTNDQAHAVVKYLATQEFPEFMLMALQFGLFKTYGVESISRLLLATRNLTDPVKSLKRYDDTAVIIGEFMINPPTHPRTLNAIARMNYLHSSYVKAGTITNNDLLYTLSVFVTEPIRFARLYEWRSFNEMEICAYGVFWKSVGDAMGISFDCLFPDRDAARSEGDGDGDREWRDGIEFADAITAWAKRYETDVMKPSVVANKPARALVPIITYWVPSFAKRFAQEMVFVLMGDRVREAFMLPEPSTAAAATIYPLIALRRLYLRHLALPRRKEIKRLGATDEKTGRMHSRMAYGNHPFYVEPTLLNRWGPKAWAIWLFGGKLPGDDPEVYMPQGYLWEDLGPRNRMGKGLEEMRVDVGRLRERGRGGCPF